MLDQESQLRVLILPSSPTSLCSRSHAQSPAKLFLGHFRFWEADNTRCAYCHIIEQHVIHWFIKRIQWDITHESCWHSSCCLAGVQSGFFSAGGGGGGRGCTPMAYGGSQAMGRIGAVAAGTAAWDLSCVCNLHHSSQQCQILHLLSEAKDHTWILMDTSHIRFPWATTGTPECFFLI